MGYAEMGGYSLKVAAHCAANACAPHSSAGPARHRRRSDKRRACAGSPSPAFRVDYRARGTFDARDPSFSVSPLQLTVEFEELRLKRKRLTCRPRLVHAFSEGREVIAS